MLQAIRLPRASPFHSLCRAVEKGPRECVTTNIKPVGKSGQSHTLQIMLLSCQVPLGFLAMLSITGQACHPHSLHSSVTLGQDSLIIVTHAG